MSGKESADIKDAATLDLAAPDQVNEVSTIASRKKTWLGYLWDTADLPSDERKLLFKVDASILLFASVSNS